MKLFYLLKLPVLTIIVLQSFASISGTIVLDNFENNQISSQWQTEGATFVLSAENQSMRIDYNRTASSWEWDQFHFILATPITLFEYQIELSIKSNIQTQLTLKPIYAGGSSDWLSRDIAISDEHTSYTFNINSSNAKDLETIYFYLDAGTTAPRAGVLFVDWIVIHTTNSIMLEGAVIESERFLQFAVAGSAEGQYPSAALTAFAQAVQAAGMVLNNSQSNQQQINEALDALNHANAVVESARIRSPKLNNLVLATPNATFETQNLFYNLRQIARHHTLFGMQDATGYGVGWSENNFRSDVEDVCGALPAVCSWSISGVAAGYGWDDLKERIQYIYNLGGINALDWHIDNPYGGDFYWWNNPYPDSNVVASILPGGINHDWYVAKLDNIALFLRNLKGSKGESIPVIFRPWHEHNGSWFWWGEDHCTIDQYKMLWQFTASYLVNNKGVTNILFAYSPDRFFTKSKYLQRYPGNNYIDIFGFDNYGDVSSVSGIPTFISQLRHLVEMAEDRGKIPALTETGLERIPNPTWFTQFMLDPIKNDTLARRIAFVAVWRNANASHHYAPYPGHPSVPDFINYYNDPFTIFLDGLPDIYGSALSITGPLGISEMNSLAKDLSIYPNPSDGLLNISNQGARLEVTITDMTGRTISSAVIEPSSSYSINLKNSESGVYLLRALDETGRNASFKIIIK